MRATEIRRLLVVILENQFLLQEAAWIRFRLLLEQLLQPLVNLTVEDRRRIEDDPRVDERLGKWFRQQQQEKQRQQNNQEQEQPHNQQQQQQLPCPSMRSELHHFRKSFARFLGAENFANNELERGNVEIHALRCEEGDVYEKLLRQISSKNYGNGNQPTQVNIGNSLSQFIVDELNNIIGVVCTGVVCK